MVDDFARLEEDCLRDGAGRAGGEIFQSIRSRLADRERLPPRFVAMAALGEQEREAGVQLWQALNRKMAALWVADTMRHAAKAGLQEADVQDLRAAWEWFHGTSEATEEGIPCFPVDALHAGAVGEVLWIQFDHLMDHGQAGMRFWRWVTCFDGAGERRCKPEREVAVRCPFVIESGGQAGAPGLAWVKVRFWKARESFLQSSPNFACVPVAGETSDLIERIYREVAGQFAALPGSGYTEWEIASSGWRMPLVNGVSLGGAAAVAFGLMREPDFHNSRSDVVVMAQLAEVDHGQRYDGLRSKLVHVKWEHAKVAAMGENTRLVIPPDSSIEPHELPASSQLVRVSTVQEAVNQASPDPVITSYLDAIILSCRYAPKATRGKEHRKVELDEVFVSLFGYPGGSREIRSRAHVRTSFDATVDPLVLQLRKALRVYAAPVHSAENLEWVLEQHRAALILGDPGSGKTTLLYQVALRLARACRKNCESRVPILIRAADLATFVEKRGRLGTLLEFVGRQAMESIPYYSGEDSQRAYAQIPDYVLHEKVLAHLQRHGAVILIDGLDEGGSAERRRMVSALVDDFLELIESDEKLKAAGIRVLITSRVVGYEQAPLASKPTRYLIEPLGPDAIDKLSANWFKAICDDADEGRETAGAFKDQLDAPENERLRSIAENPYLLTLLSSVFLDHHGMPKSRADLYRSVVDDNILKLLNERNISQSEEVIGTIMRVAFHIHGESPNGRVSLDMLTKILDGFAEVNTANQLPAAEMAVLIAKDSGLMVERGTEEYAFVHRSLQEYLAGRYLLTCVAPGREIVDHGLDPRWREPVLLALGYASLRFRAEQLEALLGQILSRDSDADSPAPVGAMLLVEAYYEITGFPRVARQQVLRTLFERYSSRAFPGNLEPFRRFVEQFFANVWGRSPIDSTEQLDVEDTLAAGLLSDDVEVAKAAAALIHERRIYSNRLAAALVSAQRHDSADSNWQIHRTLHVLVSRAELESRMPQSPAPAEAYGEFAGDVELLKTILKDLRIIPAPAEIRKMRRNLKALRIDNLKMRQALIDRPTNAQKIAEDSKRLDRIAKLGIGGFGDFETGALLRLQEFSQLFLGLGLGSAAERRSRAIQLDCFVNPVLETIGKMKPEFKPEWLIGEPAVGDELERILAGGPEISPIPENPGFVLRLFRMLSASSENAIATAAERPGLHWDAMFRLDYGGAFPEPSADPVDEARAWGKRLFAPVNNRVYMIALTLDTVGKKLAADPEVLVTAFGLSSLSRPGLARQQQGILWAPRRLDDYFVFALDVADGLVDKLGFLHGWFLTQVSPLFEDGKPLEDCRVEAVCRVVRRRDIDALLTDGVMPGPKEIKRLPAPRILSALVLMAHEIKNPYHRARAYLALADARPMRYQRLAEEAEKLLGSIGDSMDKAIILSRLATSRSRTVDNKKFRSRALRQAAWLGSSAELFRRSLEGRDLSSFSDRFIPPVEEAEPSAASVALAGIRSGYEQTRATERGPSERAWESLRANPGSGLPAVLSDLGRGWLELTPFGLEVYRGLDVDLQLRLLPFLRANNESLLTEFSQRQEFRQHASLIAAENGRWSAEVIRDLANMLASEVDATRCRAQDMLDPKRHRLRLSQIGEETYFAAISLLRERPESNSLFWFISDMRQDDPELVFHWCKSAGEEPEQQLYYLALAHCRALTEQVWRVLLDEVLSGPVIKQNAILIAFRYIAESNSSKGDHRARELQECLKVLLRSDCDERLGARVLDILGFLNVYEEEPFWWTNYAQFAARPMMLGTALMSAGRNQNALSQHEALMEVREGYIPRLGALTGRILRNLEVGSEDYSPREWLHAYLCACRGTLWDDLYRQALKRASGYVVECWENGEEEPLRELLHLTEKYLVDRESSWICRRPALSFELLDLRETLPVLAAVAEAMPANFSEAGEKFLLEWIPRLVAVGRTDPSFVVRGAAIRLMQFMPNTTPEMLNGILSGLFDVCFVSDIAREISNHLPPANELAIRELLGGMNHPSLLRITAAARVLSAACIAMTDEKGRQELRTSVFASLKDLLVGERAHYPLVTIDSSRDLGNKAGVGPSLSEELGKILFETQGVVLPAGSNEISPRYQTARTVFTVRSANAATGAERIEMGETMPLNSAFEHQFLIMRPPEHVQDLLRKIATESRKHECPISEFAHGLQQWLALRQEEGK